MPNSFESYYQEMGRAGRDGNESKCLLFYSPGDRKAIEFLVSTTNLDKNKLSESLRKLFDRPVPDPGKMTSEEIKVEIENCKKRIYQLIDKIDKTNQELGI